jgi:hypothetical protein
VRLSGAVVFEARVLWCSAGRWDDMFSNRRARATLAGWLGDSAMSALVFALLRIRDGHREMGIGNVETHFREAHLLIFTERF